MEKYYAVILTIILSLSDAFWYGYCYEKKGWFKTWLFWEWAVMGEKWVPFYRLGIQWPLDIIVLWVVYDYCGFWGVLLMVIAWYLMVKEMNYYLVLGQWKVLKRLETTKEHVYWLDRLWFSGAWVFIDGFTVKRFVYSYIAGLVMLALSALVSK